MRLNCSFVFYLQQCLWSSNDYIPIDRVHTVLYKFLSPNPHLVHLMPIAYPFFWHLSKFNNREGFLNNSIFYHSTSPGADHFVQISLPRRLSDLNLFNIPSLKTYS